MSLKSTNNSNKYDVELRSGQRIHLLLSDEADSIIESDMTIFQEGINYNGFINRIIMNFNHDARASISFEIDRQRDKLYSMLTLGNSRYTPSTSDEECIEHILAGYRKALIQEMKSFPNGSTPHKPRIQNDLYDILGMGDSEHFQEADNYGSESKHIRALLEEYARLPFIKREAIYYKETIDNINLAISKGRVISVEYAGKDRTIQPYKIIQKLEYNYLIAIDPVKGFRSNYYVLRISRIQGKVHFKNTIHISNDTRKAIDEAFSRDGIYPNYASDTITVQLTEQGYRMYNQILHLRPRGFSKTHTGEYWHIKFDCAPIQIMNYFFKFGTEAEIKSPSNLRENFRQMYTDAAKKYTEDNPAT